MADRGFTRDTGVPFRFFVELIGEFFPWASKGCVISCGHCKSCLLLGRTGTWLIRNCKSCLLLGRTGTWVGLIRNCKSCLLLGRTGTWLIRNCKSWSAFFFLVGLGLGSSGTANPAFFLVAGTSSGTANPWVGLGLGLLSEFLNGMVLFSSTITVKASFLLGPGLCFMLGCNGKCSPSFSGTCGDQRSGFSSFCTASLDANMYWSIVSTSGVKGYCLIFLSP